MSLKNVYCNIEIVLREFSQKYVSNMFVIFYKTPELAQKFMNILKQNLDFIKN